VSLLRPTFRTLLLAGLLAALAGARPSAPPASAAALPERSHVAAADTVAPAMPAAPASRSDTLRFRPSIHFFDSTGHEPDLDPDVVMEFESETSWLKAPMGDHLLDHPDLWSTHHHWRSQELVPAVDYNRVDILRLGLHYQAQRPMTMYPRVGARFEYATGRERNLYGIQMEQPLLPTARFVFGFGIVRRTEHAELELVEDVENSLAMLLTRTDYRDYYEREGAGLYLSWRVPDFSRVSLHLRDDEYRSLSVNPSVRSWFNMSRPLRENPAIDEGRARSVILRLERLTRRSSIARAGLYHWIELERAGDQLGGDFDYTRLLADVRGVVRLSPATSLSLRAVVGSELDGTLTRQKSFAVGGVDGLRAHAFKSFSGNQAALGQAEYTVGLWALRGEGFEGGLHALAFLDVGTAWQNDANRWDVANQRFATDLGFGLATSEDGMRIYVARDLNDPSAEYVWSLRLQRPF